MKTKKYGKFLLIPYFLFVIAINPNEPAYMIGIGLGLLIVLYIPYLFIKWIIQKIRGKNETATN